jgi:hypothetical protein
MAAIAYSEKELVKKFEQWCRPSLKDLLGQMSLLWGFQVRPWAQKMAELLLAHQDEADEALAKLLGEAMKEPATTPDPFSAMLRRQATAKKIPWLAHRMGHDLVCLARDETTYECRSTSE